MESKAQMRGDQRTSVSQILTAALLLNHYLLVVQSSVSQAAGSLSGNAVPSLLRKAVPGPAHRAQGCSPGGTSKDAPATWAEHSSRLPPPPCPSPWQAAGGSSGMTPVPRLSEGLRGKASGQDARLGPRPWLVRCSAETLP